MKSLIAGCAVLAASLTAVAQDRVNPAITIADIRGKLQSPFQPKPGSASVLFFITQDCPISNRYAPEIHRICDEYAGRAGCYLVYVDPTLRKDQVETHLADYRHGDYPALIDREHTFVKAVGATTTPEATVILPGGKIAYRGRIDDRYVTWGTARNEPTVHDLRAAIELALQGRPIPEPRTKSVGCYITPLEFFRKK